MVVTSVFGLVAGAIASPTRALAAVPTISVSGNHFIDGSGATIRLLGVNRSGTEFACIQGWGIFSGPSDLPSVQAIASWHVNAVRVPLNEDCWLNINMGTSTKGGAVYQQAITNYVNLLNQTGIYVILELHWTAAGTNPATGQQPMPDADHAPAFWSSVATTFKSNPGVIFDLFNEPFDIAWSCWLSGCTITGYGSGPYQSAGMQSLVSVVRSTGATQPIMIGGLHWTSDVSGWLANLPTDPLNQLVASVHFYNFGYPCNTTACYDSGTYSLAAIAAAHPVVFGELGENDCAHGFIDQFMPWADSHGYSYLGWAWIQGDCASYPALIAQYDGTPTNFGIGFRDHLAALAGLQPTVTSVVPNSGPAAGGTSVTIRGTNFTGASAVKFGTATATFTVTNATQIMATSPAGSGTVDVTITTALGSSAKSAADKFTYTLPPAAYTAQNPSRILDTRNGTGGTSAPLGPGQSLNLTVAAPAGATGVVLNFTVTNTTAASFLKVTPAGAAAASVSNLNWMAGETRANLVNVPIGTGGQVTISNGVGSVDVIADEEGYFAAPTGNAGGYNALPPQRLLDTRNGTGGCPTMGTASVCDLQVLGMGGMPASGVSAVVLNVTATNTATQGFFTLYPSLTPKATVSNLNWVKGWTLPNRVIVPVGSNGKVSIYNGQGAADAVVDVSGYFTDSSLSGKFFTALSPARVLDTRNQGGTIGPNQTLSNFQITGNNGVPAGATAVFLNTTVTNTTASGALTIFPGPTKPTASDLNWVAGQTIPNLTLATLSSIGATSFYNFVGSTDLVLDISGYFR